MSTNAIGQRLKKARLDAGLTQNDVAIRLGITYQAISNYERGINRVDTDTLSKLCKLYNIRISDLLRTPAWDEEMFKAYREAKTEAERQRYIDMWGTPAPLIEKQNNIREPEFCSLSQEEWDLIQKFRQLDQRGQSAVLNTLEHEYTALSSTLRVAARDGSYQEIQVSGKKQAELKDKLHNLPDVPDGL